MMFLSGKKWEYREGKKREGHGIRNKVWEGDVERRKDKKQTTQKKSEENDELG